MAAGLAPAWQKDGKALFFWSFDNTVMTADIRTGGTQLEAGKPRALFRWGVGTPRASNHFTVSKDGKFLITEPREDVRPQNVVVWNWLAGLPVR
jgi:hypothetical protein